jgi:hypothetical protein
LRGVIGAAAFAVFAGAMVGPASAAPDDTPGGSTDASVGVNSSIAMTALTPDFTLTGIPGETTTGVAAVAFTVETNNLAGYAVTVVPTTDTLLATAPGNTDSIPIAALKVRATGTTPFTDLDNGTPTTVHTQATRSAEGGDDFSNDYEVVIPFVNADTYTATLDYLATTL